MNRKCIHKYSSYFPYLFIIFIPLRDFRIILETKVYEGVSKSFRTESVTKYTLTTINTR
jgi:hypothetical protein